MGRERKVGFLCFVKFVVIAENGDFPNKDPSCVKIRECEFFVYE